MNPFPPLPLAGWQPTRETLHGYSRVIGDIRGALTPKQKHSWHSSLRLSAAGLTTTPIPAGSFTFEMALDLTVHRLIIATSRGAQWQKPLHGQPVAALAEDVLGILAGLDIHPKVDRGVFSTAPGAYDPSAASRFWQALSLIDAAFKRFRSEMRGETGDVQILPHGFDLAMLWFSGRLVPGQDPARASRADEQMNFGFSTGDGSIPEPYFYATAYPLPPELPSAPLPEDVVWHTKGWQGAVMKYEVLTRAADPEAKLLDYFRSVHKSGSSLMR